MIVACLKWVGVPGRSEPGDDRFEGISAADQAALESALRRAAVTGDAVTALTVGASSAERACRDALACGAARAIRIDAVPDLPSAAVALLLAGISAGADSVWCGDHSRDRGSGSVPAFLAGELGIGQALGVVGVDSGADGAIELVRRLDGGRREVLRATTPVVVSVEGSVARLRRASLPALLAARSAIIETVDGGRPLAVAASVDIRPYRPRPRALAGPHGSTALDRIRELTDATVAPRARGEVADLDPPAAALRIATALREWGYL